MHMILLLLSSDNLGYFTDLLIERYYTKCTVNDVTIWHYRYKKYNDFDFTKMSGIPLLKTSKQIFISITRIHHKHYNNNLYIIISAVKVNSKAYFDIFLLLLFFIINIPTTVYNIIIIYHNPYSYIPILCIR